MKRRLLHLCAVAVFSCIAMGAAQAGTVHGTVKNGTTGSLAAGIDVILIQLQGGMETVANTKTDAKGSFTFENPSLGERPMLVRAVYRGVNFHQAVPPGRDTVEVEIFEPTRDANSITYPTRVVVFEPKGASLLVGEEFTVQNDSKPPQALFRADGSFDLALPENATLQQVAAWGPSGMPVVQATIDRGPNRYAIAFAFRPGESGVRLSYQLPYPSNRATVRLPSVYSAGRLLVVAPPGVDLQADGLQVSGTEQGMNVYTHDPIAPGKALEFSVAGTAIALPASASGGGADAQAGGAPEVTGAIQAIPGRLDVLKWPLVAGFAGIFALGAIFLLRRPVPALAGGSMAESAPSGKSRNPAPPPANLSAMDSAVDSSLDALKDKLFKLELRHQAGTISEEEYARERARAEKILRDLVRG